MITRTASLGAALALGAMLTAAGTPASATIFTITGTGTIDSSVSPIDTVIDGLDQLGLFGAVGADLNGLAYRAVMTFDSSKGTFFSGPAGTELQGKLGGGGLTVNRVTQTFAGTSTVGAIYDTYVTPPFSFAEGYVHDFGQIGPNSVDASLDLQNVRYDGSIPVNVFTPILGNYCIVNSICDGYAIFSVTDAAGALTQTKLWLSGTSFTITAANVPEPGTWALMLLGFGGLGAMIRTRRDQLKSLPA